MGGDYTRLFPANHSFLAQRQLLRHREYSQGGKLAVYPYRGVFAPLVPDSHGEKYPSNSLGIYSPSQLGDNYKHLIIFNRAPGGQYYV